MYILDILTKGNYVTYVLLGLNIYYHVQMDNYNY